MEELREIAKAYYEAGSAQVQGLAREFYRSMDTNGDERVDLSEFLAFMGQEGYFNTQNHDFFNTQYHYFFNLLDHDGNGNLDFYEVMALYYIIKSGRPFCDWCRAFIPGTFFSCVECFKNAENSFDLCRDCYRSARCTHTHGGRAQFLDNYTLLQLVRDPALPRSSSGLNPHPAWNLPTNAIVPVPVQYNPYAVGQPPINAVVPSSVDWSKWRRNAFRAFELALNIGNVSANLCTIL